MTGTDRISEAINPHGATRRVVPSLATRWSHARGERHAGIPSRRSRRLRGKLADVTGYPLSAPPVLRQANIPMCAISVPLRAINHGQ